MNQIMNKVIKQLNRKLNFVRDGVRPPTFPRLRAAQDPHGRPLFMKNAATRLLCFAPLSLCAFALIGCKAAVSLSGSFATPAETVTAAVQATTNSVTVGGTYQTGTTNIGGAITVGK